MHTARYSPCNSHGSPVGFHGTIVLRWICLHANSWLNLSNFHANSCKLKQRHKKKGKFQALGSLGTFSLKAKLPDPNNLKQTGWKPRRLSWSLASWFSFCEDKKKSTALSSVLSPYLLVSFSLLKAKLLLFSSSKKGDAPILLHVHGSREGSLQIGCLMAFFHGR